MKKLTLIIAALLCAATAQGESVGTAGGAFTLHLALEDYMRAEWIVAPSTGTVDSARIRYLANTITNFKVLLYRASDSVCIDSTPQALCAEGTGLTKWFLFNENATIDSGATYWVTAWAESDGGAGICNIYYISVDHDGYGSNAETYGAPPSPTDAWTKDTDGAVAIMLYYTPSPPATGPPDYRHGPDGIGQRHGPDGASARHRP